MYKKLFALLSLLILASLVLTACGGAAPAEPVAEEPAAEAPAAEAPAAEAPAAWTEADATETFVYHMAEPPMVLDKWSSRTNNALRVISYLVFDPLIIQDEDGSYQPGLATSWEFSDDQLAVTFTLRDDVYFTNGENMTADDVIDTLEEIRDDVEHRPDAMAKNWRNYIGELEKLGDYSFTLHLLAPMPEFFYAATDPVLQVHSKKAYEEMGYDAFWENPVGTGPYTVTSFDDVNNIVELDIRTDEHGYWGYDATGKTTNVKHITLVTSPEAQTRLASLRSGEVDMINIVPPTEKVNLDNEGFVTELLTPMNLVWLMVTSGPDDILSNQKLREALSLSIDRDLIVETLLNGYATPAHWPARPIDLGYVENPATPLVYDPERAKQLVAETDYNGEPINFKFTLAHVNIGNELSQAIQSMAAEVGLNLQIFPLEAAVFDEARANHDYDIAMSSIGYSGNAWYKPVHDGIGVDRFNTFHQQTEEKELALSLGSIVDPVKAQAVYEQIYAIETTQFDPNIALYWPSNIQASSSKVSGALWHANQFPDLKFMNVER